MLRKQIMNKYVDVWMVFHVIWHNVSVFLRLTLRTLIFLLVLYVLFVVLDAYIVWIYLPWLFALLGVGFFVKYMIDFFNIYLDALILSQQGITMFMRDGLFDYKTDFFEWNKIEAISHTQNSFWDKVFAKWDIIITLEHGVVFPFENVYAPKKQADKIMAYKEQFSLVASDDDLQPLSNEKMSVIAEALSEVVKEYLEKKQISDADISDENNE